MSDFFAERELEFWAANEEHPQTIQVQIGVPERHEDSWRCATLLRGAPRLGEVFYAYGEDSLQALQLALFAVGARLRSLMAGGGRLTWYGDDDIRLPARDPGVMVPPA